jgi:predicted ATPase
VLDNFEQVVDTRATWRDHPRDASHQADRHHSVVLRVWGAGFRSVAQAAPLGLEPARPERHPLRAVRLFTERAMAVQPSFVTDEIAPTVVRSSSDSMAALPAQWPQRCECAVSAIRSLDQHLSLLAAVLRTAGAPATLRRSHRLFTTCSRP